MFRLHHPNHEIDTAIQRGVRWFLEEEVPFIIRSFQSGEDSLGYVLPGLELAMANFERQGILPEDMNIVDKRTAVNYINLSNSEIFQGIAEIFSKEPVPNEDGTYTFENKDRDCRWGF